MKNKVCMVTGVGDGNGRSISSRFAREGYLVAMLARTGERLDQFEEEIDGAKGFVFDVSDAGSMSATVAAVRARPEEPNVRFRWIADIKVVAILCQIEVG